MTNIKLTFSLFVFSLAILQPNADAQENKSATFWGLNPSITVEPFYEEGELDINVFPVVYQKTITHRIDLRVASIVNFGVRNENSKFSHVGAQVSFPVHFSKKENTSVPSKGFYAAPGLGLTRNLIEKHNNFGVWIEPGYNLQISPKYSISFGAQFGATHFWYDNGDTKWGNHFGIKVIIGRWF
ncbi:MAG TPA: hypothetical protein PL017_03850 [Tenuifilaceae bacterium]|nr:hypothetical protein [Tenuifilaceae bacterium]HPE17685.1 hypothetical protein [Tenuifilaceae bacterium]HPJ45208.1 hypothetical protein [Tenuifilaceae bacterium]HPQ33437.1 hypothetical protein [Tenuifilaceae bacterium]HRX66923.1 hypothetical protein [Tenuifilaceae bacterium]